jgi:DNA-binding transcriptional ArsR family regulator
MKDFSNEAYYLFFSALANRTRLALIDALKGGSKSLSQISAALKQEKDKVASNLKQLEKCVIVISETSRNERLYFLNKEVIEPLSHVLELHTAQYCPKLSECIARAKWPT